MPRLVWLVAAATTLAAPALATAGDSRNYVAVGPSASGDALINLDVTGDAGFELGGRPIWVHGLVRGGTAFDFEGSGGHLELRGGVQTMRCNRAGRWCGVAGVDAGWQRQHWSDGDADEHYSGLLVVPHAGLDAGGSRLRLHVLGEVRIYRYSADIQGGITDTDGGVGVSISLAYRL